MYLKRLEIQGFKTFANKTVFEFDRGITAVVGPNGSGKSNFGDAVRWVLGEQSLNNLRAKRTEELLFGGGSKRAPAGLAEVSLTIDNSDRLLPLDFDEVTITRRATRGGENEYFVNRARVRLRDLQEVVEPLGGSYTIINQGLVDAALTLRPEERRRLFEDAAEIGSFETRKAEAERRLRETAVNLARLEDLLAEIEPRLRLLKRQAGQARQHRELSDELHTLLNRHYRSQFRAAQRLALLADTARQQGDAALERARNTQVQLVAELHALRSTVRERREQLGALHQQSSALHQRAELLQRELAVGNERLAALARRHDDLERAAHELDLRRQEAAQEGDQAAAALQQAEAALAEQRAALSRCLQENEQVEALRRSLNEQLKAAENAALAAARALAESQSRAEQLQAQRTRLLHDRADFDSALAQADQRLQGARDQLELARKTLAEAEAASEQNHSAEHALRSTIEQTRGARHAADEARGAAHRTLADLEARLDALNRLARSYAGVFAGVKAAMQWAERSGHSGFALVSSIIQTPAAIETAIEVALGSRLQNIVVEHWQDAEDAIAELKRSNSGRATFMPLDTLRPPAERRSLGGDGVLGVAAELVAYNAHYTSVVQQLLGRVLVVRDLATARRELKQLSGGWTIVTLGGEQVNTGGAVTGGAQTKESGTLRRERELRELPGQLEAARAALTAAENERGALDGQLATLNQHLREHEQHGRDAQRRRDSARSQLDNATRQLAQAEQERALQEQRRSRLDAELDELTGREAAIASQRQEAEAQATQAQAALQAIRGRQEADQEASRAAQSRLAEARTAVGIVENQLATQRTQLAAATTRVARLAQQQAERVNAERALASERQQIDLLHARAEADHAALLQAIDELRAQIDPAEADLQQDELRQQTLEAREREATASLLEHEAQANRLNLEAQRAADRIEQIFERAVADGVALDDQSTTETEDDEQAMLLPTIERLRDRILKIGAVNPLALEEYEETQTRQQFLATQLDDLRQAGATLRELIAELDESMRQRFVATFSAVAAEFERSFTRLFGGGSATLQLIGGAASQNGSNSHEPVETLEERSFGIEIVARPPGKRQQNIALLSGGERALTASALLFAILTVNPSPFCILDEVDAALDESNVGRFREALSTLTGTTQFIVVTHNRGTIEVADTLYGVTMGDDGASKVLSLRVAEYVTSADP